MADPKLVEKILQSYKEFGGINHLDGVNLPSREAVSEIIKDLLKIIFPGYFDRTALHSDKAPFFVSQMLTSISERLRTEIEKSLEYAPSHDVSKLKHEAKRINDSFFENIPEIRRLLSMDVEAAVAGDPAALSQDEIILAYPGLISITVQRLAHFLYTNKVALLPRMMTEWAHSLTGIDIHPGAEIGDHFFIDHGTGIVIGETAIIGKHVKIYHGVTLGAKSTSKVEELRGKKRHPTIEDHATIYPGATILGGDTVIGAGSTIAGNVFLTHSVPPHSLVMFEEKKLQVLAKKRQSDSINSQDFQI
jgi:serine O-acetyltransferase